MAPADELLDRIVIALQHRFHAAIGAIAHPAVDIERMCNEPHGFTKADILHTTGDVEVQRDNAAAIENLIINDLLAAV